LTFGIFFHSLTFKITIGISGIWNLKADKEPLEKDAVEITLPSKVGYESIVRGGLAAFAKNAGFPPSRVEDLKTAVSEACINAVQHGNKGNPNAHVIVTITFKDRILGVSVCDEGDGLKEEPKDPDIVRIIDNLDPPVGFGVFLMKRLMDEVKFQKVAAHRHEVRMKMKL
jgi:serine/threonine-protein kinase RsbW